MLSLMVVDDEKYAVLGITRGIDWSDLGIEIVYEAYSTDEAKEIFKSKEIDILICDIEMPESNGIELLEWVKTNFQSTETVFLTGHANFSYAQKAVQLGCYDYILKPAEHEHLKEIVAKIIQKLKNERERKSFFETYKKYYKLWTSQLGMLTERFWQDVLCERINMDSQQLDAKLQLYEIQINSDCLILPILINVEQWKRQLNTRNETIMELALRNYADQIILKGFKGTVIQDAESNNVALIYCGPEVERRISEIKMNCMEFIKECNSSLFCELSCYIGQPSTFQRLIYTYKSLLEMERKNITKLNSALFLKDFKDTETVYLPLPPFYEWIDMFDMCKKEELIKRLEESYTEIKYEFVTCETLEAYYHGMLHMIYTVVHKKGLEVEEIYSNDELKINYSHFKSTIQLKEWTLNILSIGIDYFNQHDKNNKAIINKIQRYIQEHLSDEFSREDIALSVFLNPAYLSRLFKKEMGISLSDYIIRMRITKAKQLLVETNERISSVAEKVGYTHFSHFAKTFKKLTGMAPQEYRSKSQMMD